MAKFSGLPINNTPVGTDYVVSVQSAGGPNDVRIPLNQLGQAIGSTTRRAEFFVQADNTGGALISNNEGPDVVFSATPTGFARARILIPRDYVPNTTAKIILMFRSDSANNEALNYFVGTRATNGAAFTAWNITNAGTSAAIGVVANTTSEFTLATLAAATIASGNVINIAVRPNSAVTGNLYIYAAVLEYSAII